MGKTTDLKNRWRYHRYSAKTQARHSKASLYRFWRQRGLNSIRLVVLSQHTTERAALRAERQLIERFTMAGIKLLNDLQPTLHSGYKHSPETIELLRSKAQGVVQSRATRLRRSRSQRGRIFTPEHRAKLSAAASRRRWSPEARERLSQAHLGSTHSTATRNKLRKAALLQWAEQKGRVKSSPKGK